jgi:hypothetical protein
VTDGQSQPALGYERALAWRQPPALLKVGTFLVPSRYGREGELRRLVKPLHTFSISRWMAGANSSYALASGRTMKRTGTQPPNLGYTGYAVKECALSSD